MEEARKPSSFMTKIIRNPQQASMEWHSIMVIKTKKGRRMKRTWIKRRWSTNLTLEKTNEKKRGNGWGERTGAKAVTVKETRRGGSNPRLVSEFGRDKWRETSLSLSLLRQYGSSRSLFLCAQRQRRRQEQKVILLLPLAHPPHDSICSWQVGSPISTLMLPPTSTLWNYSPHKCYVVFAGSTFSLSSLLQSPTNSTLVSPLSLSHSSFPFSY